MGPVSREIDCRIDSEIVSDGGLCSLSENIEPLSFVHSTARFLQMDGIRILHVQFPFAQAS